jgi:hypothetical protein
MHIHQCNESTGGFGISKDTTSSPALFFTVAAYLGACPGLPAKRFFKVNGVKAGASIGFASIGSDPINLSRLFISIKEFEGETVMSKLKM